MKMGPLAAAVAAMALVAGTAHAQDMTTDKGKVSYFFGYRMGGELAGMQQSGEQIDVNTVIKGLQDAYAQKQPALTDAQLKPAMEAFQRRQQQRAQQAKADYDKAAANNLVESNKFLGATKAQAGVKALPSGVLYRVVKAGTGAKPTMASTLAMTVKGPYPLGQHPKEGDQPQNVPSIRMSEIEMQGMREALMQMPAGSEWEISVPSNLAFGNNPNSGFPPNVAVQFDVTLNSVK